MRSSETKQAYRLKFGANSMSSLWLAVVLVVAVTSNALVAAPANDHFSAGLTLMGSPASTTGTNIQATRESGEPFHGPDDDLGNSVWWQWTAPSSGRFIFSTAGSNYDTLLAVYTGNSVSSLTLVGSNDDRSGFDTTSQVAFYAQSGIIYRIAVDGAYFRTGNISLGVTGPFLPPVNDNFASRSTLPATAPLVQNGTTSLATREVEEPAHSGLSSGASSIWWSWTPLVSGNVNLSITGSGFLPTLGIYTGVSLDALTLLTASRQSIGQTETVSCAVVAGTTYVLAVDAASGLSGDVTLNISAIVEIPVNDDFDNRLTIVGSAVQTATTVGATLQSGEELENFSHGNTLWWTFTAPSTGRWRLDASASEVIPFVALYSGTSIGSLSRIARMTSFTMGGATELVFSATQGQVFQIAVSSLSEFFSTTNVAGGVQFTLQSEGAAPSNDAFANSRKISTSGTHIGSNRRAETGPQSGEAAISDSQLSDIGGSSVWWRWTAPSGVSTVTLDTIGSDFDTVLVVYSGSSLGALTVVAVNDESGSTPGQSEVVFTAVPGITYHFSVNGFLGAQGNIQLTLTGGGFVLEEELAAAAFKSQILSLGNDRYVAVSYTRKTGRGINYLLEVSDNLIDWDRTEAQVEMVGLPQSLEGGASERVTYRLKTAVTHVFQKFFRLVVTKATP